jgi:hypothetical protein
MIQKVAKAAALREAFPNTVGGLYVQEEMEHVRAEAEVITPARIIAPVQAAAEPKPKPVAAPPKPKAKPNAKKKVVKPDRDFSSVKYRPTQSPAIDWLAEFTLYGVDQAQAVLLRDSPTAADRESVMSAAESMVANDEMKQTAFDCLGRYLVELKSRKGTA